MSLHTSSPTKGATTSDILSSVSAKAAQPDYLATITAQTQAIELNPHDPLAFCARAVAYYRLGDRQSAIADYTHAIDLDPKLEVAHYRRGFLHYLAKDYSSAIIDYNRSIELKPDFALAYSNRGYVYRDLYGEQEAMIDWRFAAKLFKEQGNLKKYQEIMKAIESVNGDESCASGML
jgi:tetratricopeptide (TPR) repeat protein